MTVDARVLIGEGPDSLEGTRVTTPAGADLFREGVVVSDPSNPSERQRVVNGSAQVTIDATSLQAITSRAQQLILTAAIPLNAYKVLTTDATGKAIYADSVIVAHANKLVGIGANAANTDDTINAQFEGELTNDGWSWTPGALLFVGLNGDVTTAQTGAFSQAVGFAKTAKTIVVRLGRAIIRG